MTSFQKRFLSTIILAPFVLLILYNGGWPFVGLILIVSAVALWEWIVLVRKTSRPLVFGAFGIFYICLAAIGLKALGEWAVIFVVMISLSDIAAYGAGRTIGGPKLWPSLSPRKTWVGLIAALIPPFIIGYYMAYRILFVLAPWDMTEQDMLLGALVGGCIGIGIGLLAQAGDLLISALKRTANTKDSGDLIPGHGGVLDRIDSLLLPAALFGLFVFFG